MRVTHAELAAAHLDDNNTWLVSFLRGGPSFVVDPTRMTWRLDTPAPRAQKKPLEAQARHCFESCGLEHLPTVAWQ